MPASTKKFLAPKSYDYEIGDAKTEAKFGELRIKPSSILWKGKSEQKYHSVSLDDFVAWIKTAGTLVAK
jgi:hypothetical protein